MGERPRPPRLGRLGLLVLTTSILGVGCGNVTAGGFGETKVILSGDAEGSEEASSLSAASVPFEFASSEGTGGPERTASAGRPVPEAGGRVQGTVRVEFRISLLTEAGGFPVDLTRGEQTVVVDASGEVEQEVVSVELQRGIYRHVRIVFSHVSAEVERGPSEEPLTVEVDLTGEGGQVVVERPIFLLVEDRSRQELVVDLRSRAWIALENVPPPARQVVAANVFRNAVRVSVR